MLAPPSKPKSNSAPPDRAPAQEPAQRPPFKDFCANAFAKKTRDKITLRILEAILGVTGCDQLDAAMGSLTKFDPSARYSYEIGSPSSLAALAYAPKLRKVTLWYGCPVVDLSPLENLTELTLLWMGGTKIKDLSPLRRLTKLENVDVRTSKVNDITPLMELPNLKTLTIQNLRVPRTQIDQFKSKHPGADVFF
jgi:hypothetical protein